jgi:hypothetical protein
MSGLVRQSVRQSGRCVMDGESKPPTGFQRGTSGKKSINDQFVSVHTNRFVALQLWMAPHSSEERSVTWETVEGDGAGELFAPDVSAFERKLSKYSR